MLPHDLPPPWHAIHQQARFRRLSRDYERLPDSLAGLHWPASVFLMLKNLF